MMAEKVQKEKPKKKSEAGKGDSPRPFSVPLDEYGKRWELAFGKRKKKTENRKQKTEREK